MCFGEKVLTHDGDGRNIVWVWESDFLGFTIKKIKRYDVIAFDEAHFFSDLNELVVKLVEKCHRKVIVAGLDGSFERFPFPILNLIPLANTVTKLSAICMKCNSEADFTLRIRESRDLDLVGGKESYMAVCRFCYCTKIKQ